MAAGKNRDRDVQHVMNAIRMGAITLAVVVLVLGVRGPAQAQEESDVSKQLWAEFDPTYYLDSTLNLYGDIGARTSLESDDWWRLVIRPSIRKQIKGTFHISGGVGSFYMFNDVIEDRWEIRPFQGAEIDWPRGKHLALHHYMRLEQRFDFNTSTWVSKVSLRLRYLLGAKYKFAAARAERFWQVSASGEAFWTLAGEQGQFRESSRVTLGVDRSFAKDRHVRFEVTWQRRSWFFDPSESVSDVYFRIRFTKSWGHQ